MPKGGACRFCSLPDEVRIEAVSQWKQGAGAVMVGKFLDSKGFPLSVAVIANCLTRGQHHGARNEDAGRDYAAQRLGKIAALLERSGIDLEDVGQVKTVRLSEWQGLTKQDGEAQLHDLSAASIVLTPSWDTGPQWPVVQPARPCIVKPLPKKMPRSSAAKTAVILPDVQIGYRRDIDTADLDPFHDEAAMQAALRVVKATNPDLVVHLGDLLDFASFGTFEIEAGFSLTVQPALDRAHRWMVEVQANAPNAKQVLLEGNHDRRLQKAIVKNALAAFGIRRGNAPDEWPVLSVPYLLRLDELEVEYVGGYPAGIYWINDRLCCIHGHKVRSSASTAAAVVDDERISVIFGHVHRIETKYKTRRVRHGHRTSLACSAGCLCRIDGTVPSTKGSTDPMGRAIPSVEDWQQAVVVVSYQDGDAPFSVEPVPIFEGKVLFRGEEL